MRFINYLFIFIFISLIIIPMLFIDFSSNRVSVQENRMLADKPNLTDIKKHPIKFIQNFDSWFKDSIGFREELITFYNKIEKNTLLNGILYMDGSFIHLIGEQGHHFFGDYYGRLISKFQGKPILSDNQLINMTSKLDELNKYLGKKNIPLIIMFCSDKETIYPEFYPKQIKQGPEPIQLDIITNYIKDNTSVDIFNIKQALLSQKDNYLLYPLIDSFASTPEYFAHYNELGAFFSYKELMKHINIYFPNIVPFELENINISFDKNEQPVLTLKTEKTAKKLEASFFGDLVFNTNALWAQEAFENNNFTITPPPPVIKLFYYSAIVMPWIIILVSILLSILIEQS